MASSLRRGEEGSGTDGGKWDFGGGKHQKANGPGKRGKDS